jgi:hypothetical protein
MEVGTDKTSIKELKEMLFLQVNKEYKFSVTDLF